MNWLHHLPLLIVCMATLVEADSNSHSWDYSSANGPQNWAKNYKHFCAGVKQSPIDLSVKHSVENLHLKNIHFDYQPSNTDQINITVKNNGHSLVLTWSPNLVIRMGIDSTYTHEAAQLHWHWGSDSSKGSEHTLDGKAYAAEGHLVFFNMDYGNLSNAVDKPNGLAVLGVFHELSNISNSLIKWLEAGLKNDSRYQGVNESVTFSENEFDLTSLFLPNNTDYFRYDGSLTTPECFESVVWTVFKHPVPISLNQLILLRGLKLFNSSASMQDNFRPPTLLNNYDRIATPRTVYRNFTDSTTAATSSPAVNNNPATTTSTTNQTCPVCPKGAAIMLANITPVALATAVALVAIWCVQN